MPQNPVIKSNVYSQEPAGMRNVLTIPNYPTTSTPIIPIYANDTEQARAVLRDEPFIAVNNETRDLTIQTALPLPVPAIPSIPTATVTSGTGIGDWIQANPVIAAGGGALILYSLYLLTKRRRK